MLVTRCAGHVQVHVTNRLCTHTCACIYFACTFVHMCINSHIQWVHVRWCFNWLLLVLIDWWPLLKFNVFFYRRHSIILAAPPPFFHTPHFLTTSANPLQNQLYSRVTWNLSVNVAVRPVSTRDLSLEKEKRLVSLFLIPEGRECNMLWVDVSYVSSSGCTSTACGFC